MNRRACFVVSGFPSLISFPISRVEADFNNNIYSNQSKQSSQSINQSINQSTNQIILESTQLNATNQPTYQELSLSNEMPRRARPSYITHARPCQTAYQLFTVSSSFIGPFLWDTIFTFWRTRQVKQCLVVVAVAVAVAAVAVHLCTSHRLIARKRGEQSTSVLPRLPCFGVCPVLA